MQRCLRHIAHILPVDFDRPARDIIKPEQNPPDGRFARPRWPHKRNPLPRCHPQRHAFQDGAGRIVRERYVVKHHLAASDHQIARAGFVVHLGRLAQKTKHLAHIHQSLADFAVNRTQKPQRHGDLDHIGVDHHEIAHRQHLRLHAKRRHHHNADQSRGYDQALTKVQRRQR